MTNNIKTWLAGAGETVEETIIREKTALPFIVFFDTIDRRGADTANLITHHSTRVERYSATDTANAALEALLEAAALEYSREILWLDDQLCYETIYEFEFDTTGG